MIKEHKSFDVGGLNVNYLFSIIQVYKANLILKVALLL